MESDLELKPHGGDLRARRDTDLSIRLAKVFEGQSISSVGRQTGYHPESVRRYLLGGGGRIPADFLRQVVGEFGLSAHHLLTGIQRTPNDFELRMVTTDHLINELGRRIRMIEDNAVGSILIRKGEKD